MASPSTFVTVNAPVGVAVATDRLLYTQHSVANAGDPTIFSVSGGGVVDIFAPSFPSEAGIIEKYIDINPGLGPWATKAHYVYVTQGQRIYEITPDGLAVTPFATIPTAVATHTGVTFDREGTFNHDMIVTDRSGNVFRVDSFGNVMTPPIANVDEQLIEGPAVVPVGFGPNGGEVWVAAEDRGVVFAVRNDGTVSVITREIPGAEYVRVIPTALAELEASGGAYFTADYPQRIVKYPASDFAGLGGNVLVGQEVSGGAIMMISESGGAYSVSPFDPHAYTGSAEGAAFAEPGRALLVYAAKFLCGRFEGESEQLEGPVKPGNYRTAINIHNPNRHSVAFVKKAVLLFAGSTLLAARELEVPRPPGKRYRLELRPDWGVEIDCRDIREVLLRDAVDAEPTVRSPVFIKGWVVVESASALDVEVVYTAHGLREGRPEGFAMTTERVLPTNITTDWTHSR